MKAKPKLFDIIDEVLPAKVPEEKHNPRYIGTRFENVLTMSTKGRGKVYEDYTRDLIAYFGHTVQKPISRLTGKLTPKGKPSKKTDTDYDCIINKVKYEIKGAIELASREGFYIFNQIRLDQSYKFLIFSFFRPDGKVSIWVMSKEKFQEHDANGLFRNQHGGKDAESGTIVLTISEEGLEKLGAICFDDFF